MADPTNEATRENLPMTKEYYEPIDPEWEADVRSVEMSERSEKHAL